MVGLAFQHVLAVCIFQKKEVCPLWKSKALPDGISLVEKAVLVSMSAWGSCVIGVPLLCAMQQHPALWVPSVLWDWEAHHGA